MQSYDGRESAPAAATQNYLRYIDDATNLATPVPSARASGRSIGTIGVPRLMEAVQRDHGRLAFKDLMNDGIGLATNGFKIGGRLAAAIASNATNLKRDAEATAYFFNADGTPKALGTVLTNPAYAASLTAYANGGADAIMHRPDRGRHRRQDRDDARGRRLGDHARQDHARRPRRVPGEAPRSGLHHLSQLLGLRHGSADLGRHHGRLGARHPRELQPRAAEPTAIDLEGGKPTVQGVHLVSEAERLAYADRDKYVADTDFVPLPGNSVDTLLNKPYLQSRARLISLAMSLGHRTGRQPRAGAATASTARSSTAPTSSRSSTARATC